MPLIGIYKISSKIKPECIYLGSAVSIKKRWANHLSDLRKKKHHNNILQNHYTKYGEQDLVFSILLQCEKEDLIKNEQYFIDTLKPYFNICKIAGSPLGAKRSDEAKLRMSKAQKGNKNRLGFKDSEETRNNMSKAQKGHKHKLGTTHTDEAKLKMSLAKMGNKINLGKKHSDEAKAKMSKTKKGKTLSNETKAKLSEILKGNKRCLGNKASSETKQKMSEAQQKRWAIKKQLMLI